MTMIALEKVQDFDVLWCFSPKKSFSFFLKFHENHKNLNVVTCFDTRCLKSAFKIIIVRIVSRRKIKIVCYLHSLSYTREGLSSRWWRPKLRRRRRRHTCRRCRPGGTWKLSFLAILQLLLQYNILESGATSLTSKVWKLYDSG